MKLADLEDLPPLCTRSGESLVSYLAVLQEARFIPPRHVTRKAVSPSVRRAANEGNPVPVPMHPATTSRTAAAPTFHVPLYLDELNRPDSS
jgi:hypothetical protein